jgi:predicted amino acid dehydrogenase
MKRILSLPQPAPMHRTSGTLMIGGQPLTVERLPAPTAGLPAAGAVTADGAPLCDGSTAYLPLLRFTVARAAALQPDLFIGRTAALLNPARDAAVLDQLSSLTAAVLLADPALCALPFPLPTTPAALQRQRRLAPFWPGRGLSRSAARSLRRAAILIGTAAELLALPDPLLTAKTVVCLSPQAADLDTLQQRGVAVVITAHAPLDGLDYLSAAEIDALAAAFHDTDRPSSAQLLNLLATAGWEPNIVELAPPPRPRFAFVIHPLKTAHIANHRNYRWTRRLPPRIVEWFAAFMPPLYLSTIRGIRSAYDGREVEGVLMTLGSTPREMLRRPAEATYRRLVAAARIGQQRGARLLGLGAFTSVVGDAGVTVANRAEIGITSGNTLTVAATLETGRQALQLVHGRLPAAVQPLVIGATGSIGSACARLLARRYGRVALVAPRPERLLLLQRQIEHETPEAVVTIAVNAAELARSADLIITTTSALSGKVLNVDHLKPGAVVCDVARPADVTAEDAARRPDVLFIESGEILLPGAPDFGFDIDMPPGTAYACLAETALLAMEGLYGDYTLGRAIEPERVSHVDRLWQKHGLRLAPLRSFDRVLTEPQVELVRRAARQHHAESFAALERTRRA